MPAKMCPHSKLLCLLFIGSTLGFDTKQRNSFFLSNLVFFYNKSKILTIFFTVKYEKITLFDEFLALSGPLISRFFACSNEEKKLTKTTKGARSSPISMTPAYYSTVSIKERKSFILSVCSTLR
jgi:hypothetical protein